MRWLVGELVALALGAALVSIVLACASASALMVYLALWPLRWLVVGVKRRCAGTRLP